MAALRLPAPLALAALALTLAACDTTPATRQARAGTAIALETRHTASALARALAERPDPACGAWEAAVPMRAVVSWTVEGFRGAAPVLELNETRRLELDSQGGVTLLRDVDFRTPVGRAGQRAREWRYVAGALYTRDLNLPFERRQADVTDRGRLVDDVPQVFETLVRAGAGGWRIAETDGGWTLALGAGPGEPGPIRCGREGDPDPWLDALLARARVVDATARVRLDDGGRPVERTGAWTLELLDTEDPMTVEAAVEEHLEWHAEIAPISAPDAVFDASRERLFDDLGRFLRAVDEEEGSGVRGFEGATDGGNPE